MHFFYVDGCNPYFTERRLIDKILDKTKISLVYAPPVLRF